MTKVILNKRVVGERVGNKSTRTIERWANDPEYEHLDFPKPVQLGDNSVGFLEEEIDEWIARRAAMRDEQEGGVAP